MFDDPFYITMTSLGLLQVKTDDPTRREYLRVIAKTGVRRAIEKLRAMPKPRLP